MFPILLNPIPLLLTISTAFGVFVHDVQLTHIAQAASIPAISAGYMAASEVAHKFSDQHPHVERMNLGRSSSNQPSIQPRNGEDKKYISQKKFNSNSTATDYSWPSA